MDAVRTPVPLLVPTKLAPPPPLPTWVERERLLARLTSAAHTPLVLVVAPAGFGKTTLVAQWLRSHAPQARAVDAPRQREPVPPPFAWLTLDEYDQDGLRFIAYVVGAIERALDRALATTGVLLAAEEPLPLHVLLQALLVDLSGLPNGLTLVLDDYHTVTARPVHQLVAYLLRHLPPRCRLILLSRTEPPLPLARLSAAGQLCIVRAADLRFTEEEAFALLRQRGRATVDEAAVLALHRQTEGWALALQLALVEQPEVAGGTVLPTLARSQLGEYLAWEVLAQQPAHTQRTLLALAVPNRFCAELCAALLDTPEAVGDAERRIDELVRAGLLVVPLDEERRWFRFHHLFRDLLLRQLRRSADEEAVRALRLRAARWFGAARLVEEAIRLYLEAGDEDAAAELVEREMGPTLGRNIREAPPGSWLRLLPAAVIARRPGLALVQARLAEARLDVQTMAASLARVETLLASAAVTERESLWPTFNGDRLALQGMLNNWQYRPAQALLAFEQALHQPVSAALNASMLNHMGVAMVAEGRYAEGVALLRTGSFPPGGTASGLPLVSRYLGLCQLHLQEGEFNALHSDASAMAELVCTQQLEERWASYAAGFVGRAAYERGDFVAAAEAFHNAVSGGYKLNIARYINCLAGLARVAALQGDSAAAARYEQEVQVFAQEAGAVVLRDYARACAAWLALAAGDLAGALRLAQALGPDQMHATFTFDTPQLVRAGALIASGGRLGLAEAEAVVADCVAAAERLHRTRHLVIALGTQALLRQAQGCPAEALAPLERAVGLAAPRAMGRTLLDLGPTLRPLLRTLAERGVAHAYLERLLAQEQPRPEVKLQAANLQSERLPEMLTRREQEVLALLAERWSNQEIAERLCITNNTTRKHTSTIYDKLGVNGRREAVAVARALGLLPPM
jgi:LuxR family maltose regulon positive regulatory protein